MTYFIYIYVSTISNSFTIGNIYWYLLFPVDGQICMNYTFLIILSELSAFFSGSVESFFLYCLFLFIFQEENYNRNDVLKSMNSYNNNNKKTKSKIWCRSTCFALSNQKRVKKKFFSFFFISLVKFIYFSFRNLFAHSFIFFNRFSIRTVVVVVVHFFSVSTK